MSEPAVADKLKDYLDRTFEGLDAEYVDGRIVPRALPTLAHTETQQNLTEAFGPLRKSRRIEAGPSLRVRVAATRIRIADYVVFRDLQAETIPSGPALLVVEIIAPSDCHSALIRKLEDYRAWGAENIWVIDPELRWLSVYRDDALIRVQRLELPELGVVLGPDELFG
jgi:Uma2 family endonuclease